MADFVPGWNPDREDWDYLAEPTAVSFSAPGDFTPPPSMNLRAVLKVEMQGRMGSCVGHGASSGMEQLEYLTSRQTLQFSRMYAYIMAQRQSGIRGDNGAEIAPAVQMLIEGGCCLESEMPYPNPVRYSNKVSQSAITAAAKYKILGHQQLNSGREVFDWISQGKGPVLFGFPWFFRVSQGNGLVTQDSLRGGDEGGHCNVFVGYTGEVGPDGNPLIDDLNSHGTQSGQGGWFKWTWGAIDALANLGRRRAVMIGMTNITGFDPDRLVNFENVV